MKPDWKDAPIGAKFLAQDGDERWWWYADEPFWDDDLQRWDTEGEIWQAFVMDTVAPEETLERRP